MGTETKRILITGATGMVGSHLAKELIKQGYKVRASFRKNHPEIAGVQWEQADILDVVALEEIFEGIDIVFHCAAQVSFDPSNANSLYKNNVEGTANMVNAAIDAQVKKFVYVSSVAAIGASANQLITETSPWQDNEIHNDYAKTKHAAEMEVRRGELEGLEIYMVNPSIILGCGDWNTGSTELFKKIYNGFSYYTEGIHGFVDVEDVVKVLAAFLDEKNRHLNGQRFILNSENISYKNLFDKIADGFSVPRPSKKVTPLMAALVWRLSYLKGKLTGKPSMLTKNSARIAQSDIQYDNRKILEALPDFRFQPLEKSIRRICQELKEKYKV
ncbi:MAG: 3-beta hydroxysteroid dehydrogenase [Pseudopedobacter saltans]|uniref:3-beta hydroxysteroid dehydrogenase n=1 Tax=Pseudopedobacter saltans TaxID=151895 RepID=A0A2W5F4U0_9SPHI|nr:MAG: 3-beta hydroxysteroid dehydrogenase [Pseudopedobacter saltans]